MLSFDEFRATVEDMVVNTWEGEINADPGIQAMQPLFMLCNKDDKCTLVELPGFESPQHKDYVADMLRLGVLAEQAKHTCFVSEVWIILAKVDTPEKVEAFNAFRALGAPFYTHPDATEQLILQFATVEAPHNRMVKYTIQRGAPGEKAVLIPNPSYDEADPSLVTGRFANLYYPGVLRK